MNNHINAIVLVCLTDSNYNAELLELSLISIRKKARFKGDIIVFTDFTRPLNGEEDYAITRVHIDKLPSEDPRNFRIYMNEYYDFSKHKKIIYIDFDILVMSNINRVFDQIKTDAIYFTYAPYFEWHDDAFTAGSYIDDYRNTTIVKNSITGICSGIFGIRTHMLDNLLKIWRKVLEDTPTDNDQHALNEVIVKGMFKAISYPNEWVSYPLQIRNESDDRRVFKKNKHFIFYHYNPYSNETKFQEMSRHLNDSNA